MPDAVLAEDVEAAVRSSLASRQEAHHPFRHAVLRDVFPARLAAAMARLPFQPADLAGVSGTREVHNATRRYFDPAVQREFPVAGLVAMAFQAPGLCGELVATFGVALDDTFLRIEYATDCDGFWLAPHTDLGVKKLTCLIYLDSGPGMADLGTDLYASPADHHGSVPFEPNSALCFVPGSDTWHGFEKRTIPGVRRSMIVNYVTRDWRAKEQLSFPMAAVQPARTAPV